MTSIKRLMFSSTQMTNKYFNQQLLYIALANDNNIPYRLIVGNNIFNYSRKK